MLLYTLNILFTSYTFMLLIRVFGSWFPNLSQNRFMYFIAFYTDPYLNVFRKILPPFGPLDISPMIAFFVLQIIEAIVFKILR